MLPSDCNTHMVSKTFKNKRIHILLTLILLQKTVPAPTFFLFSYFLIFFQLPTMVWNVWYGGELSRWVELLIINVFPEVFFLRKEPLPSASRLFTPLLKLFYIYFWKNAWLYFNKRRGGCKEGSSMEIKVELPSQLWGMCVEFDPQ